MTATEADAIEVPHVRAHVGRTHRQFVTVDNPTGTPAVFVVTASAPAAFRLDPNDDSEDEPRGNQLRTEGSVPLQPMPAGADSAGGRGGGMVWVGPYQQRRVGVLYTPRCVCV